METKKSIFKSKVFWIAVVQGIIGVLVVMETNMPEIGWIAIVKSVLDMGMRMITTAPVALKGE